jgi:hypothetical protein
VQQIDLPLPGLSELPAKIRERISSLPSGPERHAMLKAIWQGDAAAKLQEWSSSLSPGLREN